MLLTASSFVNSDKASDDTLCLKIVLSTSQVLQDKRSSNVVLSQRGNIAPAWNTVSRSVAPWGAGGAMADQFTLSQPGEADYAHHINTGTPGFSDLPTALVSEQQQLSSQRA